MNYYNKSVQKIYEEFNTSKNGLSKEESSDRLKSDGLNKLVSVKQKSLLVKFLSQFKDLMVIVLIGAAVISFITAYLENEPLTDSYIILAIVIFNAILGFVQELKADKAIESLSKLSASVVKVRRNDEVVVEQVENIVRGDILLVEAGDFIAADCRVINSHYLKVDEASLTGESIEVLKKSNKINGNCDLSECSNMVFSGSAVVYGKGELVVVETGMNTQLGLIAKSLTQQKEVITPLQKKINHISKVLTIIIGFIITIMFIIGILKGHSFMEVFILSISLAVAAIPEGLTAVITIILSLGMIKLSKVNAIVRKISSVETLGSTSVICTDKTGTLTKSVMEVKKFYYNDGIVDHIDNEYFLKNMILCNDVKKSDNKYIGDTTEIALYKYVEKNMNQYFNMNNKRVNDFPFDSTRKLMSVVYKENDSNVVYTKGSLDSLLDKCNRSLSNGKVVKLSKKKKEEILLNEELLSNKALRVLAFGYKVLKEGKVNELDDVESDLIFIGLVGMIDPPREGVKDSISSCLEVGIKPVMITGDSLNTAVAIAKEVGIYTKGSLAIKGSDLDNVSDEELTKDISKYSVFARVSPFHKLRIVKAWQKNGKVVAMTGDGVNDAPAIKAADVGIGMGITGTEVTKNVADIVLGDDSFNTIVVAVNEGRNIFENIRKVITYLLTANIAEIIIVFVAMIFDSNIFLPIHLLYINLVTDSLPAIALSFEHNDDRILKRKVRSNSNSIFTPFITANIVISSIIKAISILLLYFTSISLFGLENAVTIAFLGLIITEMVFAFTCRNLYYTIFNKNFFKNKQMNISILFLIVIQLIVFNTPVKSLFSITDISLIELGYISLFVGVTFIIGEVSKKFIKDKFED